MGKVKGPLLINILVKVLEAVEVGEIAFFQIPVNKNLVLAKSNFLKDSCNTTLYMLDLI